MDIYIKRRRGKILLLLIAVLIGLASLLYTNWLTNKIEQEERNKVELWAAANEHINNIEINFMNEHGEAVTQSGAAKPKSSSEEFDNLNNKYLSFLSSITEQNTTIPIIVLNAKGEINSDANIKYSKTRRDEVLKRELRKMKAKVKPIRINLPQEDYLLLYYRESSILRNLRIYPFVQLVVILIFIVVSYFAFNATNRAQQNQIWVGMSKETAHQLGTPISSLMAWIELLKLKNVDENLVSELEQDTKRLERITERFSKIGSKPELLQTNVVETLNSTVNYLKNRSSNKVKFQINYKQDASIEAPLNAALFSWVIENICKNAIDAMGNDGTITLQLQEKENQIFIDISDTGTGIPKSHYKTIFQPGYSTKKRGWGLGLSLTKRIVELYHNGKVFVKSSETGEGSTFRIILEKQAIKG